MTSSPKDQRKPDRLVAARLEKLQKIKDLGLDPWGQRFDDHIPIAEARDKCPDEPGLDGDTVRVAGRIMLRNNCGKLKFYHVQDFTGRIQLMVSRGDLSDETWELIGALDLGDLIGIDGTLRVSKTGEKTIFAKSLTMLCKSLAQPPEKFHGAKDIEMLLRQRSIDLIYNDGVLDRLLRRTRIIQSIRQTLVDENFVEVETPVLHAVAGGAAARPFTTEHNTLGIDLFLRIALELHLKRLMVGGVERVFEIGRVFRNEGIDATHNPEFTMLELYQAYGDYRSMMDITEKIVVNAAEMLGDGMVLPWGDQQVDFTPPWPRKTYAELFREHAGCDAGDTEAVAEIAKQLEIDTQGVHPDVVLNKVFEETVEDALVGPVFVIDYPASLCPLTKRKTDDPEIAERFELFIHGMELANAYTELNDPLLQDELFRTQLDGLDDEDSMAKLDTEFLEALKIGMPPAGGLGVGIDRLVMLLTNSRSIRDVIFFPLLRPETQPDAKSSEPNPEMNDQSDEVTKTNSTE